MQQMQQLFEESGLTSRYEPLAETIVSAALLEYFDLEGSLERIDTEKDSTFRLRRDQGDFLVKVSPADEPLPIVRCQTDVIDWVERTDPTIPVQSVLRTKGGSNYQELRNAEGTYLGALRVLEFIPGTMLGEARPTPEQLGKVGAMLGRVDLALEKFEHEGLDRPLVWDIGQFMILEPLLEYETNPDRRAMAEQVFELYREQLEPVRAGLRTQAIHGDFSAFNAVVDPANPEFLSGVIDFGDVQHSPLIFEAAVLFANHLSPAPAHPWLTSRDMLIGYQQVVPLTEEEIRLLAVASIARVTLRALVTNWRIAHVPERADYLRMHAREDWDRIANALDFGIDAGADFLLTARDLAEQEQDRQEQQGQAAPAR